MDRGRPAWLSPSAIKTLLALALVGLTTSVSLAETPALAKQPTGTTVAQGYKVYRSYALTASHKGLSGTIRLLQDERITDAIRQAHWGVDGASWGEQAQTPPMRPAKIEMLDANGNPLASQTLDVLADLQEESFDRQGTPIYLLTVDESIGAGTNNGLVTTSLNPHQDGLKPMQVVSTRQTAAPQTLRLLQSLRAAWQLTPAQAGQGKDILAVSSPPGGKPTASRIYYTRYHLAGNRWIATQRSQKGLWLNEFDDAFPPSSRFP